MKTIYKYKLETTDVQTIIGPIEEILTVQVQNGIPCLWAIADPQKEHRSIKIETFGTGNPIEVDEPRSYIGSYQLYEGKLVFHVFTTATLLV